MYRINVFVTLSTFTCNYPKCMICMLVLFLSPATPPFIFHLFNCYLLRVHLCNNYSDKKYRSDEHPITITVMVNVFTN